jgi:hypothetical protein
MISHRHRGKKEGDAVWQRAMRGVMSECARRENLELPQVNREAPFPIRSIFSCASSSRLHNYNPVKIAPKLTIEEEGKKYISFDKHFFLQRQREIGDTTKSSIPYQRVDWRVQIEGKACLRIDD